MNIQHIHGVPPLYTNTFLIITNAKHGILIDAAAEQGRARMGVTVGITNTEHLNSVVARLKKIKDVVSVTRN